MAALTTVITHATGDVYPASDFNTYTRDNLNYLMTAGAALSVTANSLAITNEYHKVTVGGTVNSIVATAPVTGQRLRLNITATTTFANGAGNIVTDSGADHVSYIGEELEFWYDGTNWLLITSAAIRWGSSFDLVNNAALTAIFSQAIPGGLLGLTGGLEILITGDYLNNTGGNRTFTLQVAYGATIFWGDVTPNIAAVSTKRNFFLHAILFNNGATNQNLLSGIVSMGSTTAGSIAGFGVMSGTDDYFHTSIRGILGAEDTTAAKTLEISAQHSGLANALLEFRGTVHVRHLPSS